MDDISSFNLQIKYNKGAESDRYEIFNNLQGKFLKSSIDKYRNYLITVIIRFEGERKYYQRIKIVADKLKGSYFFYRKMIMEQG